MVQVLNYKLNGKTFFFQNFGLLPKIGDWGFSMKTSSPTPILSFVAHRIRKAYDLPDRLTIEEINLPEYDMHFLVEDLYKFFPDNDDVIDLLDELLDFEGTLSDVLSSQIFSEFTRKPRGSTVNMGYYP